MPGNKSASIAVILTVILLLVIAVFSIFMQLVAFNGAGERQGITAMGISLICQAAGIVVLTVLARRLTGLLITKLNWNGTLAVAAAVFLSVLFGAGLSFLSIIISALAAGIE
ncbi:MAG: hypothetical protein FJZ87_00245 [Chloroflexi bacterium]|nr:hypothetical protein [Chloroflexota bacterium]